MPAKFVRLKPYNPRGGHKVKRIDWRDPVSGQWYTFAKAGVWHKVDAAVADRMAIVHQDQYDESTPLVFDVETETGARQLDAAARAAREAARAEREPTVDTAVDLTHGSEADSRAAALDAVDDDAEPVEPEPVEPDSAEPVPEPGLGAVDTDPEPAENERPKRTIKPRSSARTRKTSVTRKPKRKSV